MRGANLGVLLSVVLHGAAAIGIAKLPKDPPAHKATSISMVSPPKKPKPAEEKLKEPEPPKPDPPSPAPVKAKAAPPKAEAPPPEAPAAAAAPQAPAAANIPNLGNLALGPGGPGGIAVPTGGAASPAAAAAAAPAPTQRDLSAQAAKPRGEDCSEEATKPKPAGVSQPSLTSAAQAAQVEGKVRVQVSIDATGAVTDARVTAGLGYGLDEACIAAAKKAKFTPASKCGKPATSTFTLVFRFAAE